MCGCSREPTLRLVDLMTLLVNCQSPLIRSSHCMTTCWPTAAKSNPRHAIQGIFMLDSLPATSVHISRLEDQLRVCWLAYLGAWLSETGCDVIYCM